MKLIVYLSSFLILNISFLFECTINNRSIHAVDMEQALIDKLFKNYNKKLRPAGTVEVKFALNLNQIINLIEKDQIIVLNVFIDHEWTDNRLKWYYYYILFLIFHFKFCKYNYHI
jgi:hypothetical protein